MRCECCNVLLTPREATRRFKESGSYVDMCDRCLDTISDQVEYTAGNNIQDDDDFSDLKEDIDED